MLRDNALYQLSRPLRSPPTDPLRHNLPVIRPLPLLLLDIDGVLSAHGTPQPPSGYTEHHLFPGKEPARVNPAHDAWITKASTVLDIAWATNWNEQANQLLAPLLHIAPCPPSPCHRHRSTPALRSRSSRPKHGTSPRRGSTTSTQPKLRDGCALGALAPATLVPKGGYHANSDWRSELEVGRARMAST